MTAVPVTNDPATGATENTASLALPASEADAEPLTPEERAEIERAVQRIEHFPREFGWLMVYVGVLGVLLPGIVGLPFVFAGGAVVMPGGRKWLSRWVARNPGRLVRASLKQIVRMADDIERRYPSLPGATS
ncbi:MAG: hypothetical protein ABSG51_18435 [Terracidiphilus sp.]|jgi:hypothetical protein